MSDSSESDVSSPYSSDGEVLTLFQRTADSPPSSDESETSTGRKEPSSPFPLVALRADERAEICDILASKPDTPNIQIFPSSVRQRLTQRYPHIVSRLSELPGREHSVVVATRNLLTSIEEATRKKPAPKDVCFDLCVFSPREPVLVLTITSGRGKKDRLTRYNSELTRHILQHVRRSTGHSFSTVYGMIEDSLCQSRDSFVSKVKRLEQDAQVMALAQALVMNQSKCMDIIKSFLQLLPVDASLDPPQDSARQDDEHKDKLNMEALLKRIEQLELAQADVQRKYVEKEKREQEHTAKYDHVVAELQQIKQDYLTDVRLSLLMRPRSSSVSESTVSGYGSTEVGSDIPDRQEAGAASSGPPQGAEKGDTAEHPPQQHPELSTEAIHTGDIELVQYNRDITLYQASEEGKLGVVEYILSQGVADINCRGKWGRTPVMAAALNGQVTVFDYLVSQGCDLSAVDDYKDNVLHMACYGGSTDIVRKLVESRKCDIESRGNHGRTPVMCAAQNGHRGVVDLLKSAGCQLTAIDDSRATVLHVACLSGHVDMLKYILSLDIVSIESTEKYGLTPVMYAAAQGHRGVFDLLVSAGSSLTTTSDDRATVLHMACLGGNVDMVKYILSLDIVSIESRGYNGRTPVMTAAVQGHRGVFDLLVSAGSSLTTTSDHRDTVLHMACLGGNVDMVKYILSLDIVSIESRGYNGRTPVMTAAGKGHTGVFDLLVSAGSSLTTTSDDRDTVLHMACLGGNVDMVKYILSLDIVSIESREQYGRTPVMYAAEKGHRGVFDLLVSAGSSITTTDDDGNTLLHVACIGGDVDIVKHLLTLGVVGEKEKNKTGQTPVKIAELKGHTAVVSLLKARK